MSRTFKDAPEWVKTVRETYHCAWRHNQFLIGRETVKTVSARNSDGSKKTETIIEEIPVYGYFKENEWFGYTVAYKTVEFEQPVYEDKVYKTWENYCTCGLEHINNDRTSKKNLFPCVKYLTPAVQSKYYQEQYPNVNHPGGRKRTKQNLKQLKTVYNSTQDYDALDEDDYADVYSFKAPLFWVW